jgi:hypothetical protein
VVLTHLRATFFLVTARGRWRAPRATHRRRWRGWQIFRNPPYYRLKDVAQPLQATFDCAHKRGAKFFIDCELPGASPRDSALRIATQCKWRSADSP